MTYTVDPKLVPWFIVGIVVWMAFVVCVGYFGSRGRHDGEKFVTGGRDMNAFLIFCTLGATIIGTGSTIGAISDGFSHAWGGALFCTGSAIGLLLLSTFSGVREKGFITMSEEAQYYYGGKKIVRQVMGFTMFAAEIIWLGNHITGGATYLSFVFGIDPIWCKLITALAFGAYVFIGGYVAVVKADVIQFCAIVLGFGIIAWKAIPLAGGYDEIARAYAAAGKPGAMGFYGLGSYGVMAGISLVLAMTTSVLGCPGNRTRIYTARDARTARRAFLGQGALMFGWGIITAIIGMSCFAIAMHNGHLAGFKPDHAFPYMATQVIGPALGLMFLICGLSAAVSSGGSSSISGITILLTDVYPSLTGRKIPPFRHRHDRLHPEGRRRVPARRGRRDARGALLETRHLAGCARVRRRGHHARNCNCGRAIVRGVGPRDIRRAGYSGDHGIGGGCGFWLAPLAARHDARRPARRGGARGARRGG